MYPASELFVYERMFLFLGTSVYYRDAVAGNSSVAVTSAEWCVIIKAEGTKH